MIKISVIVPVYNKKDEIKKCLESIINQTLKEIEIIVINDGSTDNSLTIIEELTKNCKLKITVIDQKNQGIGYTRNVGIRLAKGEFLSFVDGDDYIEKEMLMEYYNYAKKENLDVLTGYYNKIYNNKKSIFINQYFDICNIKNNSNIINLIDYGPCNKIFKKSIVDKYAIFFDEKHKYEDIPFVSKFVSKSERIGHLNKSFYNYYIRDNSETTVMDKRVFDIFDVLKVVNNNYKILKGTQELEYFNIEKITTYMLQQRYQREKLLIKLFIEQGYEYLNSNYKNWRRNIIYKKTLFIKRLIKNNKYILTIYVNLYRNVSKIYAIICLAFWR